MKNIIRKIFKLNKFTWKIWIKMSGDKRVKIYEKYVKENKIDENLVLFEAFMGRKCADSPKSIYLEMLKNDKYKNYKFIWAFKEEKEYDFFDYERTTIVLYASDEYINAMTKAKYIISNSRLPMYINVREDQVFVQCWHGTPLKRLGFDIEVKGENAKMNNDTLKQKYLEDAKKFKYLISPSKACSEKLSSAFNLKSLNKENCIIEQGYPRNDYLINYKENDVKKIKKELSIPKNKKVILYAPTWRENQYKTGKGYTYDLGINFDTLQKELNNEYVLLFRAHYFISNSFDFGKYKDFIIDVSDYEDINDLYIVSDILISDYSSVFFDYANLKRPILFYMYDFDEYKNNMRDFYFDLKILPGPIVKTEKDLIREINNINNYNNTYKVKYDSFNAKFNYLDDGKATKRVLDIIFKN